MSIHYSPKIVTDNLILCLDAASYKSYPGSGNTWYDLSAKNNHANLSNTSFNATNKSIQLNGSTSQINISNFDNITSEHTILVFLKSNVNLGNTVSSSSRKTIFKTYSSWNPGLWMTGRIIRVHAPPEYRDYTFSYNTFTDWFLVGQKFDGNNVYTILNENIILSTFMSNEYSQVYDSTLNFGYELNRSSATLNGEISKILVYNKSLTNQQITQNFYSARSRFNL